MLALERAGTAFAQVPASFDVCEATIGDLQTAMASGRVTSSQLVALYLNRILAYDQAGPRLNAVLFVNPRAAAQARELAAERKRRGPRGPLHGIPVLLKDNFDTSDMPTTGGCLALRGAVPRQDAFQVRKLREAGAIVLGKINLHELALGLTTVSSLGGQTLNPYDVRRAPGGSSGGSGVAAAANFAAFTMGTDTSGSIRIPSSHNSIVGLRPSAGLSSRAGIIPFGYTQDTGGPMARTVTDVAIVLDATVGYDPADPVTAASKGKIPRTYTSALKRDALKGARIGMLAEFFGSAPEDRDVDVVLRKAIDDMKAQGAATLDVSVPDIAAMLMASNLLVQELKFYLGDYLKQSRGAHVKSVEELLASGLHTAQFQMFLEGANTIPDGYLAGEDYKSRLAARSALGQAIVKVMDDNRLDAIVYPTARRIAPEIGGNQIGSNAGLSAQTGFPAVTVPAGFTSGGFPVGIEMIARPFGESTLLGLAYAYEQATHHRRPPASTPPLAEARSAREGGQLGRPGVRSTELQLGPVAASSDVGGVAFEITATGAQSIPPSNVPFTARGRFSFNRATRELGYTVTLSGNSNDVGGVYLHRRGNRMNGGVAAILAGRSELDPPKPVAKESSGRLTLTEPEVTDLLAGKLYVSVISKTNPRRSARANLVVA